MDTKALRQKILDLAIHGKLVPQDPNDEPASVLLQRIREEKERLIKEGKIKKGKKSAKTSDTAHYENVPFEVPESWEWSKVENLSYDLIYGTSEKSSNTGLVPVLRMGNINRQGGIDWNNLVFTSNKDDIEKYRLLPNDLLFNRTNSSKWVGKTAIFKENRTAIFAGYIIRLRTIIVNPDYVNYVMNSSYHRAWCNEVKTDAVNQSNINAQKLSQFLIPIPPLTEQQRIVAEIERWLSLIDIIESGKENIKSAVSQAKAKILDLAIHGKLIPQNPADEPASELLRRINPKAEITSDNAHYQQMPDKWTVAPMQILCSLIDGEKQTGVERINLDVKFLRGEREAKNICSGKYVAANTLLILVDGENSGEVFRTPIEGYQGSTFKQLTINENIYTEYILQVINLHRKTLRENKVGSAIPHLNKKLFKAIDVPIPPYKEQVRIVNAIEQAFTILDTIVEKL